MVIGYGDGEHEEFKRQSDEFAAAWEAEGNPVTRIVLESLNHFDVEREFAKVKSPVMKATWANMGLE